MTLDMKRTAIVIVDPQNDFLSEGGVVWDLVGKGVKETKVVEHLVELKKTAKKEGIPVLYSPHYYSDEEYEKWSNLNPRSQDVSKGDLGCRVSSRTSA
ncbi:MAG: isochorismatase family protein [Candidatus Thorarchaeota archaeon]|jgi:nicotinamidase-related amidase